MLNQTFILEYVDEGFLLHESASLRHPRYLPNEDNFDPKICDLCRHGRREVWYNVRNAPREPQLWGRCKKSCQLTTGLATAAVRILAKRCSDRPTCQPTTFCTSGAAQAVHRDICDLGRVRGVQLASLAICAAKALVVAPAKVVVS
jgi:hypothetical protein